MLLDLAAKSYPAFLSKNYFNRNADEHSDLLVTSGSSFRHRLFDMDPLSYWTSQGSSDAVTEEIQFGLWTPGAQTSRSIDYIALMNHNLDDFTIELSNDNGASWPTLYTFTSVIDQNTRQSVATPIDADRVRIRMTTTQTANQEKQIGDIIIAGADFQPDVGLSLYKRKPFIVKDKTALMHDNSVRRSYIYRSDASLHFFGATLGFSGIAFDDLQQFRDLLKNEPFLVMPEPGDIPSEIFLCGVEPDSYVENYIALSKSGAFAVSFDLREVGGA